MVRSLFLRHAYYDQMVYALQGHVENMIAITPCAYSGWEISMMKELAPELEGVDTSVIASVSEMNMEELAAMKPDLVICRDTQTDQAAQLRSLGIPVVMLTAATDMETPRSLITMLGDILNCQDQAARMMAWYDEVEDYVDSKSEEVQALADEDRPRVLRFMYVEELNIYANGVNPYITDWVGGQNIKLEGASAETSSPTMEEILAYDPEIVFLSNFDDVTPEDLYNNRLEGQDWSNVSAVKNLCGYVSRRKGVCYGLWMEDKNVRRGKNRMSKEEQAREMSGRKLSQKAYRTLLASLIVLLAGLALLSLRVGRYRVSVADVIHIFISRIMPVENHYYAGAFRRDRQRRDGLPDGCD